MPIWIADISNWQAGLNVEQVIAEGYTAVVCKATEGTNFRDGQFDGWIRRIRAAGAIPGAYHFIRAGDGAAQARFFHSRLTPHGGPAGMLIQLDCEADASWDTIRAWVAEWNRLTDSHPFLLYTGAWWWKPRGFKGASLTPYLWHSSYVDGSDYGSRLYAKVPGSWWTPGYGGWDRATILQFSSKGRVAGQNIDVNAFAGSLDELRALTRNGKDNTSMDLSYNPYGKPAEFGGREAGVLLADIYGQILGGKSPYDGSPGWLSLQVATARDNAKTAADQATAAAGQAKAAADGVAALKLGGVNPDEVAAKVVAGIDYGKLAKAVADEVATRLES